jgi:hypothetical protein
VAEKAVPFFTTEAILLIGDAQQNGSMTWPPVFRAIHAYKIVSAQFLYCVIMTFSVTELA